MYPLRDVTFALPPSRRNARCRFLYEGTTTTNPPSRSQDHVLNRRKLGDPGNSVNGGLTTRGDCDRHNHVDLEPVNSEKSDPSLPDMLVAAS